MKEHISISDNTVPSFPICSKSSEILAGRCCCNCAYLITLNCHPGNKSFGKGSIKENCGYACTVQLDEMDTKNAIFFDRNHGGCELHSYGLSENND